MLLKLGLTIYLTIDLRESEPILSDTCIFKSWCSLSRQRLRDYSFEAEGLILLCVFNIAGFIERLVGDTSLRSIYLLSVSRMKAYFTFTEYLYKVCNTSESLWSACFVSFSTTKFIIH